LSGSLTASVMPPLIGKNMLMYRNAWRVCARAVVPSFCIFSVSVRYFPVVDEGPASDRVRKNVALESQIWVAIVRLRALTFSGEPSRAGGVPREGVGAGATCSIGCGVGAREVLLSRRLPVSGPLESEGRLC
jgi:hypothetical protein